MINAYNMNANKLKFILYHWVIINFDIIEFKPLHLPNTLMFKHQVNFSMLDVMI